MRRVPLIALLAIALVAVPLGGRAARAAEPLVLVYGDSLVFEAQPYAEELLRDVGHVHYRVVGFGGAATCDFLPLMRDDARSLRPTAVVIAFSGNSFSPCMQDASGKSVRGDEWIARYRAASREAIAIFSAGSPSIWLATAPISKWAEDARDPWPAKFDRMLRDVADADPRVHIAEAGAAVLYNGNWARWLPCLASELCTGGVDIWGRPVNIVRSHDGTHFCPGPFVAFERCPIYSSGAMRFAGGMLVPVLRSLGRFSPERARNTVFAAWPG